MMKFKVQVVFAILIDVEVLVLIRMMGRTSVLAVGRIRDMRRIMTRSRIRVKKWI